MGLKMLFTSKYESYVGFFYTDDATVTIFHSAHKSEVTVTARQSQGNQSRFDFDREEMRAAKDETGRQRKQTQG